MLEYDSEAARASEAIWRQRAVEAKAKRTPTVMSEQPMEAGYVERRVAELEGALARERSLRTGPAAATNLTYLKNTLLQYIRAPTSEKGMMVKAISAVLHLTPEEMRELSIADEEAKAASGLLGFLWHDPHRRAKVSFRLCEPFVHRLGFSDLHLFALVLCFY